MPTVSRRALLVGAAGIAAGPSIARAASQTTLRFSPQQDLAVLDPVATTAYMSRNHGYMVFDTLYGMDSQFQPQPQMAEGHRIEDDGKRWDITLRDGLVFHDGSKVLARDCVASIRRWAKRDPFGGTLMAVTDELSAPDDRTIRFRLKQPFPLLSMALGKAGVPVCAMMPERLADTDPFKAVTEMVGSGPFRYAADERVPGSLNVYRRFENYVPRSGTTPGGWTAGPKVVHFDRVEWAYIPDPATVTNATLNGEAAWQEYAYADLLPVLRRGRNVEVTVNDPTGFVNMIRLNELQPPFNNPAIRRALWRGIDQNAFMEAVVGGEGSLARNPLGFFGPGTPMASSAGVDVLTSRRDPERAKQELREAGYKGETVLLMIPSTSPALAALGEVAADLFRRCGMMVEVYSVEFNAMLSRRIRKDPVAAGGWSAYVTNWVGLDWLNPAVHISLRGNGEAAAPGWPTSTRIEELRGRWLEAPDLATQQDICRQIQLQAFEDVPYYPIGAFLQPTAYRKDMITGLNEGFATFWNVRPV